MNDQSKADDTSPTVGISEAERMAKVRELLVGPAIADQSVVVNQLIDGLNVQVREQQETIAFLKSRIQELEDSQRIGIRRLQTRLLGAVEALLADDDDLLPRLSKNKFLSQKLDDDSVHDNT